MAKRRRCEFPAQVLSLYYFRSEAFLALPPEEQRAKLVEKSAEFRARMKEHAATRARRLAAARAKGQHTAEEWGRLVMAFLGRCVRCLTETGKPQKDHIVPIYAGGSDGLENLQPLCRTCNAAKGPEQIDHRPTAAEALGVAWP